jgi:hypothetical protein
MKLLTLQKLSFLFLTPYIVGWAPADSSYDEYTFGVGGGQYATYDCAGNAHPNSFVDGGVKVTHKFVSPFRIGLNTSIASLDKKARIFPYPDLALDYRYFSLGTTGIRIGSEDDIYGEISLLNQVPFFSGKGFLHAGVGMNVAEGTHLWLGMNTFPYNNAGVAGQIDFPIANNQFLFINGRAGQSGGVSEYGFSIGTRVRITNH